MEEDWKDCEDEAERVGLQVRYDCDLHHLVSTSSKDMKTDGSGSK